MVRDLDPYNGKPQPDYYRDAYKPPDQQGRIVPAWRDGLPNGTEPKNERPHTFREGESYDRWGSKMGKQLAETGTPFAERGLPAESLAADYQRVNVLKDFPPADAATRPGWNDVGVMKGVTADQPFAKGGADQFRVEGTVDGKEINIHWLEANNYVSIETLKAGH